MKITPPISEDDDIDDSDDNTQHTHTHSTHKQMGAAHTTDDAHRRGHSPSVKRLGRSMHTRGDNKEGSGIWNGNGSDHYMGI